MSVKTRTKLTISGNFLLGNQQFKKMKIIVSSKKQNQNPSITTVTITYRIIATVDLFMTENLNFTKGKIAEREIQFLKKQVNHYNQYGNNDWEVAS